MRSLDVYWEHPHAFVEALETDDIDTPLREVLDRVHPSMRWTNAMGDANYRRFATASIARGSTGRLVRMQAPRLRWWP